MPSFSFGSVLATILLISSLSTASLALSFTSKRYKDIPYRPASSASFNAEKKCAGCLSAQQKIGHAPPRHGFHSWRKLEQRQQKYLLVHWPPAGQSGRGGGRYQLPAFARSAGARHGRRLRRRRGLDQPTHCRLRRRPRPYLRHGPLGGGRFSCAAGHRRHAIHKAGSGPKPRQRSRAQRPGGGQYVRLSAENGIPHRQAIPNLVWPQPRRLAGRVALLSGTFGGTADAYFFGRENLPQHQRRLESNPRKITIVGHQ